MMDHALQYVGRGRPVFPCGPDKRPLVPHGFKAATTDPAAVRAWWGQWPDALIAVPTGEHTGIVVLDPDVRPGIDGNDTLYALEERHGKLPPTVEALTPSGGRHIYFRHPGQPVPCSAGKLGPGLDVRGDGGYVVVPPSRNGAGGWEWEASNPSEPAELPVAWISLLVAPRHEEGPRRPEDTPIGEGQRNAHLTSLAGAMRRRGASADALRGALHAENEARCRPPLGAAEVDRIAASVHRYAPGEEAPGEGTGPGAIRIVDGELARIVAESEAALLAAGGVYRRGGVPVHVRRVDDAQPAAGVARALGTPVIAACSPELLVLRLATDARFARYSGRRKKWEATNPPAYVGRFLVAKGEWTFPPLAGVVNAPTLRADGSVLEAQGYDPATGLLVDFDRIAFPPVPSAPRFADARAALDRLAELIAEFPFADPGEGGGRVSRAVLLAALLTAPVRRSLPTAPLFLIDAPKPGTGKTFAAELVALLATGRLPAVMAHAADGAEERKRLLASLLAGDAVTLIDNVEAVLRSDVLCAVLTAASYRDRLLGQNVNATVPTATTWLANGNNVSVQGDLTRRVLLCRMDAGIETPDARTFRGNPRAALDARRPELLVDALTVLRAHHVAGRPAPGLAPFGSFEAWSGWIRAALVWLGEADPLGNRPALEANDPEREALRNLLTAWDGEYGESTVLAGELARRHADWAKAADHADPLAEALDGIPHAPRGGLTARALGQYLQRVRDKVEAGLRLRRSGTYHSTALWRVEPAGGGNGGF